MLRHCISIRNAAAGQCVLVDVQRGRGLFVPSSPPPPPPPPPPSPPPPHPLILLLLPLLLLLSFEN